MRKVRVTYPSGGHWSYIKKKFLGIIPYTYADKYIEETNHWGDVFWGVCDGVGESNLGKVLMGIREFWNVKSN